MTHSNSIIKIDGKLFASKVPNEQNVPFIEKKTYENRLQAISKKGVLCPNPTDLVVIEGACAFHIIPLI